MNCWKCLNELTTADGIQGGLLCRKCFEGEKLEEHLGLPKEMEPRFTVEDVKNWLDCLDHKGDVIMELKQLLRDPQEGLAAVTTRNKEDK